MTTRKAIALASLMLGLAVLSPASALAKKAGNTDRPVRDIRASISGTVTLDKRTGEFVGHGAGVGTHLGEYTAELNGFGALDPSTFRFAGSGTATFVAEDGDQFTGTATLTTSSLAGECHTTQVLTEVESGTGRFEDADGRLETVLRVCTVVDGITRLSKVEGTTTGWISY